MPVKTFDESILWPASNHHWMAPGAVQNAAAYGGPGLDKGALRQNQSGEWEILMGRLPTAADDRQGEWIYFEPSDDQHVFHASAFRRYGPGWSYGPGHNMHDEVDGYYRDLYGVELSVMEQMDIEHDQALWNKLRNDWKERFGGTPDEPIPPPPSPPPTPGPELPPPPAPVVRYSLVELIAKLPSWGATLPDGKGLGKRAAVREFFRWVEGN